MPALLAPVLISAFGISATIATIAADVIVALASSAALYAYQALKGQPSQAGAPAAAEVDQNIKQGAYPRYVVLGKGRVGGVLWFYETDGSSMYIASIISSDVIGGVLAVYLNGNEVLRDASGLVTTPPYNYGGTKYVQIEPHYGFADQVASTILQTAFPGTVTAQHTASGVAYVVAKILAPTSALYQTILQNRVPELATLALGSLVWDPRDATQDQNAQVTWKTTTNPALLALYYLTSLQGMNISRLAFAGDTFSAVATYCDALVPLANGSQRPRYECGLLYSMADDPVSILNQIFDTFAGRLYITQNGLIGLTCDDLDIANITITPNQIVDISIDVGTGALYEFTSVKSRFTSENHGYMANGEEADPWVDQALRLLVGRDIANSFDLPGVFRHDQARRLMKKRFYKVNPKYTVKMVTDFNGLELFGESIFRLQYPALGIDQNFRIDSVAADSTEGFAKISVQGSSIAPESLVWNPATEEGTAPAIPPTTGGANAPAIPTINLVEVGSISGVSALISWTANVGSTQLQEAQYKLSSGSAWTVVSISSSARAFLLSSLTSGSSYDFEVRVTDPSYGVSNWSSITFTATAGTDTISAPVAFSAQDAIARVAVFGTQANVNAALYLQFCVVDAGSSADWSSPIYILAGKGQSGSMTVASIVGTRWVYMRSMGINNDFSAVLGPLAVTVSAAITTAGTGSTTSAGGGSSGGNNNQGGTGVSTGSVTASSIGGSVY